MAADGGRFNQRKVTSGQPEPHWCHLREDRRCALGTGPKGLGCLCVGCWHKSGALITAMVIVADEPLCFECASRGRQ